MHACVRPCVCVCMCVHACVCVRACARLCMHALGARQLPGVVCNAHSARDSIAAQVAYASSHDAPGACMHRRERSARSRSSCHLHRHHPLRAVCSQNANPCARINSKSGQTTGQLSHLCPNVLVRLKQKGACRAIRVLRASAQALIVWVQLHAACR